MTSLSDFNRPVTRSNAFVAAFLAVATLVVYARVSNNDFVNWDDGVYVTENAQVQAGLSLRSIAWAWRATVTGNWHPLTWMSLQLDWQLFALKPWGFHLTNLLLHAANVVLLFHVLVRMTQARWRSALVAGLFALHPLHVESVAWAAERKDVLSTLLGLLTILAYVRYVERPSVGRYGWMAAIYALGLTAKAMFVTLPFVLLLLDFWPLGRFGKGFGRLVWEKLPLFLVAAASSIVAFYAQHSIGSVVFLERLPFQARLANTLITYVAYLGHTFWPMGLAVHYPHPRPQLLSVGVFAAAVFLAAIFGIVFRLRRRFPYLIVGWCWYLGTLVPVIGLVQVGGQAMADRYTYVPLVGIFVAVVWSLGDLASRLRLGRIAATCAAAAALAGCAALTVVQIGYWRDSLSLWTHTLAMTENNEVADYNFGLLLAHQNRLREALGFFEKAVQIEPTFGLAQNNLGLVLNGLGYPKEAIPHFIAALQIDPGNADAHNNLGTAFRRLGRTEEALAAFRAALEINPRHSMAYFNMGMVFAGQGQLQKAADSLARAIRTDPGDPMLRCEMGEVLLHQGKLDDAEVHLKEAVRLQPNLARALDNLGIVQCLRGNRQGANQLFQEAIAREPGTGAYHYDLAHSLLGSGDVGAAAAHYGQGLKLDPDWPAGASRRAWQLATAPDAQTRNGALAVRLAEQVCEATDYQRAEYLDTLAAAYAEAGRFDDAVGAARKAQNGAPEASAEAAAMRARLEGYLRHQPFRQSPRSAVPLSSSAK
jgi:tetratricopeptide (TPR) repeat protein